MNIKLISLSLSLAFAAIFLTSCGSDPSFSLTSEELGFNQINNQTSEINVLWIIDNSGSMAPAQSKLTANFNSFITNFSAQSIDYRIAVATTDAYLGSDDPNIFDKCNSNYNPFIARFRNGDEPEESFTSDNPVIFSFPNNSNYCQIADNYYTNYGYNQAGLSYSGVRVITPSTPDIVNTFLTNATVGIRGSGLEQGMESLRAAIDSSHNSDFLRDDAYLAVIIVTDENDSSPETAAYYKNYLDTITNSTDELQRYSVSTVTKRTDPVTGDDTCAEANHSASSVGVKYEELAALTNGDTISLCDNFADSLTNLATNIITRALLSNFIIDREPIVNTINILVNGEEVLMSDGTAAGWQYSNPTTGDNAGKHVITFIGDAVPPAGASIKINFDPATFN